MGGCYQKKEFTNLEELLRFIKEQIEAAHEVGLFLAQGSILESDSEPNHYTWSAYFSK